MVPRTRLSRGFTLMELVVAMAVLAVMAAVSVPKLMDMRPQRLRRAAHELAMHIRLVRDYAIATQRHTWLVFNLGAERYAAYIEHPDNPGRANRIYLPHPVTGGNFIVTLDSGDFALSLIHISEPTRPY